MTEVKNSNFVFKLNYKLLVMLTPKRFEKFSHVIDNINDSLKYFPLSIKNKIFVEQNQV